MVQSSAPAYASVRGNPCGGPARMQAGQPQTQTAAARKVSCDWSLCMSWRACTRPSRMQTGTRGFRLRRRPAPARGENSEGCLSRSGYVQSIDPRWEQCARNPSGRHSSHGTPSSPTDSHAVEASNSGGEGGKKLPFSSLQNRWTSTGTPPKVVMLMVCETASGCIYPPRNTY